MTNVRGNILLGTYPTTAALVELRGELLEWAGPDGPEPTMRQFLEQKMRAANDPMWHEDGAVESHLAVLEGWFLGQVRHSPDPRTAQKAATAWRSIRLSESLVSRGYDGLYRWYPPAPSGGTTDAEPLALIERIEKHRGKCYAIPFPVVWRTSQTNQLRATVLVARVSVLKDLAAYAGLPRVLLAPWSPYLPHKKDFCALQEEFKDLAEFHCEAHFLLELLSENQDEEGPGKNPPHWLIVEGESLGVAILLAARAAQDQPTLTPVVATGQIKNRKIERVEDVGLKGEAVQAYADKRQIEIKFLVPVANEQDFSSSDLVKRTPIDELVKNFWESIIVLLSDGCDDYRTHLSTLHDSLAETEKMFWRDFAEPVRNGPSLKDWFDESKHTTSRVSANLCPVAVLPFRTDPRLAAQHVAAEVLALAVARQRETIPLLFPLYPAEHSPTEGEAAPLHLVAHLRQGVLDSQYSPDKAQPNADLISKGSLRNLLLHFDQRVVLIVYDRPSLKLNYAAEDGQHVKTLFKELVQWAPDVRVLLLASDLHHYLWLESILNR